MSFLSFVLDKMTKILTIVFVCGTVAVVLSFLLSVREATVCSAQSHNGFKYFLKKHYCLFVPRVGVGTGVPPLPDKSNPYLQSSQKSHELPPYRWGV